MSDVNPIRFLRLPEVEGVTGMSRSSIYRLIQEKKFPDPIRLQKPSISVWRSDAVQKWIIETTESVSATVSE
jgi:prophage regulatory protein